MLFVCVARFGVGDRCHYSDGSSSWSSHSGPAGHWDPGFPRLRGRSVSFFSFLNIQYINSILLFDSFCLLGTKTLSGSIATMDMCVRHFRQASGEFVPFGFTLYKKKLSTFCSAFSILPRPVSVQQENKIIVKRFCCTIWSRCNYFFILRWWFVL